MAREKAAVAFSSAASRTQITRSSPVGMVYINQSEWSAAAPPAVTSNRATTVSMMNLAWPSFWRLRRQVVMFTWTRPRRFIGGVARTSTFASRRLPVALVRKLPACVQSNRSAMVGRSRPIWRLRGYEEYERFSFRGGTWLFGEAPHERSPPVSNRNVSLATTDCSPNWRDSRRGSSLRCRRRCRSVPSRACRASCHGRLPRRR